MNPEINKNLSLSELISDAVQYSYSTPEQITLDQYQDEILSLGEEILPLTHYHEIKEKLNPVRLYKAQSLYFVVLPFTPALNGLSKEEKAQHKYFYVLRKNEDGVTHNFGRQSGKIVEILPEEIVELCSIKGSEDGTISSADIFKAYNNLRRICGLTPFSADEVNNSAPRMNVAKTRIFENK